MGAGRLPHLLEVFPEVSEVARALTAAGWTVAVAESCTGGLLGAALTAQPGSSQYMRGGVIAYADEVKVAHLGVAAETLAAVGAVSADVAAGMASGVRSRYEADLGLGVTGVAGPGAEEGGKPAGLVFVAAATAGGVAVRRLGGDQGREANRVGAVRAALELALECATGRGMGAGESDARRGPSGQR